MQHYLVWDLGLGLKVCSICRSSGEGFGLKRNSLISGAGLSFQLTMSVGGVIAPVFILQG